MASIPETLLTQIAKHWGYEVGDKVRQEIESVIGAHNVDIDRLQSAIATIQQLLDADPSTEEFDVGQNIITQLTDHLARITNLENEVAKLKGDENTVGSVAYAVKQERDARVAADQALQEQIDQIKGGGSGSIASLQSEVDTIEQAVGLNDDGTYTPNSNANYISDATSIKDATEKLDAAIKSVEQQVADAKSEAMSYAEQVAQQEAEQAKTEAIEQAKNDVFNTIANISAATLASIFRHAMDCAFDGKSREDVLNDSGDCAPAGTNSNSDDASGGDGAVV